METLTRKSIISKYNVLKEEAIELLQDNGLEWQDEFLNPKDFSPEWDFGMEDDARWFNIVLGKILILYDILNYNL